MSNFANTSAQSAQSSTDDMEIDSTPVAFQGEWPNKRLKLDNLESFETTDSVQSSKPHDSTINLHQRYVTSPAPLRYIGATSRTSPSDPVVISNESFQSFDFGALHDLRPENEIEMNPSLEVEVNSASQQFGYSGLLAPESRVNITESTQDSEAGSGEPMQIYPKLEVLRTELRNGIRPNWQRVPEILKCLFIEWSAETVELFGNNIIKSIDNQFRSQQGSPGSSQTAWSAMFEAFLTDIRNPMSNINNIVNASYSPTTGGNAVESLARSLLIISLRLQTSQFSDILWELHYANLNNFDYWARVFYAKDNNTTAPDCGENPEDPSEAFNAIPIRSIPKYWVPNVSAAQSGVDSFIKYIHDREREDKLFAFCAQLTQYIHNNSGWDLSWRCQPNQQQLDLITHYGEAFNFVKYIGPEDFAKLFKSGGPRVGSLPAEIGLRAAFLTQLPMLLSNIDENIEDFLSKRSAPAHHAVRSTSFPDGMEPGQQVLELSQTMIFYSLPGCGKTRAVEKILSKHWGFCFTAGSLDHIGDQRRTLDSTTNIYDPRREGYPLDLHYLWKTVQKFSQLYPDNGLSESTTIYWIRLLIYSRVLVFERFLTCASRKNLSSPSVWLQFQKEVDPFSPLFWFLMLLAPSLTSIPSLLDGNNFPQAAHTLRNGSFFVTIDEAQQDLLNHFTISQLDFEGESYFSNSSAPFLLVFREIYDQLCFPLDNPNHPTEIINPSCIISGTSLHIQKMESFVGNTIGVMSLRPNLITKFPLLRTDQELQELLRERDFSADHGFSEQMLRWIETHSHPLRGRYLWTTMFLDTLEARAPAQTLTEASIKDIADQVAKRAKKDLMERLSRLRDQGRHHDLLSHLCWVVVNCDILDREQVITVDEDNDLVINGFAMVNTDGSNRGMIVENLAMEAAVDRFRHEDFELLEKKMKEMMKMSALDDALFGKATEWFLAFEIFSLLRTEQSSDQGHSTRLVGSPRVLRRKNVFQKLCKAWPVPAQKCSLPLTSSSDCYRLVLGRRIGYALDGSQVYSCKDPSDKTQNSTSDKTQNPQGKLELWDYLASLREEAEPRAAVYFPDNNAGPDIIFALEPTDPITKIDPKNQRILCVVQSKTGGIEDIKATIRTTDLWNAYEAEISDSKTSKGSESSAQIQTSIDHLAYLKEKQAKVRQELQYWKGRTVLRILLATQQETIARKTEDSVKVERKNFPENELNDFFVLFGGSSVADLFGKDFESMLHQLKLKPADSNAVIKKRAGSSGHTGG